MSSLANYYPQLAGYGLATSTRISGPSRVQGYKVDPTDSNLETARYIKHPDVDFYRPWLANPPNGSAFVWPLGIQGFQYSSQATTGIHHYIGDNDVDVDIVYPDELHVTLSGHFPGNTSSDFMNALRQVILDPVGANGKILSLPGVQDQLQFVKVISHLFSHDETDNTNSIAYSVEMIKVGLGSDIKLQVNIPTKTNPSPRTKPRGQSPKQVVSKGGRQTAHKITKSVYGDSSTDAVYRFIQNNADALEKAGIPAYTIPFTPIPAGQKLAY